MKTLFLAIVLFPIYIYAQDIGVNHYERKIDLTEVFLPGDSFNSDFYEISFPDSLYTFAQIKLKKVILPNTKVSLEFNVKDDKYTTTKVSVKKGKRKRAFLTLLENKLGTKVTEKNKQCLRYNDASVRLEVHKEKRTFYYVFTLENCH